MKKVLTFILFMSIGFVYSQEDSLIVSALKNGKVSGYWRNFLMVTTNHGDLKDWNALATGGLLKYETGAYHNFKIGIGYYTSYNLNISDITARDERTGRESRYDIGLFDITDPSKKEIHFLGELYLKYETKEHILTIGRQKMKTAFLNPEDGRMIPTLNQGIWYKNKQLKHTAFGLGWLTHIGVRSSTGFNKVENSISIYPVGRNLDGSASGYRNNISSAGIGIASVTYKRNKWRVHAIDYFVENVFNTAYLLADYKVKSFGLDWKISGQYVRQDQVNNGGNVELNKAYFQSNSSNTFGFQLQARTKSKWTFSGNYNRITGHGRFLFPREWGRETLFTFQKRERSEGVGDMHAWVIVVSKKLVFKNESSVVVKVGYGQYYRPDVTNTRLNKFAMPANDQLNVDLFYNFGKPLKGLGFEYLMTYKGAIGNTYENDNFVINKVDMFNHSLIMNYRF